MRPAWKNDKIVCVIVPQKSVNKNMFTVFVAADESSILTSVEVEATLSIENRFKYNISLNCKISIPRRAFDQLKSHNSIDTCYTRICEPGSNYNKRLYNKTLNVFLEVWKDENGGSPKSLYFRSGALIQEVL